MGANIGTFSSKAQDALIATAIEWYYFQGDTYGGQEFFKSEGSLLQYTTSLGSGQLKEIPAQDAI